jgi:hypothetical protein
MRYRNQILGTNIHATIVEKAKCIKIFEKIKQQSMQKTNNFKILIHF